MADKAVAGVWAALALRLDGAVHFFMDGAHGLCFGHMQDMPVSFCHGITLLSGIRKGRPFPNAQTDMLLFCCSSFFSVGNIPVYQLVKRGF